MKISSRGSVYLVRKEEQEPRAVREEGLGRRKSVGDGDVTDKRLSNNGNIRQIGREGERGEGGSDRRTTQEKKVSENIVRLQALFSPPPPIERENIVEKKRSATQTKSKTQKQTQMPTEANPTTEHPRITRPRSHERCESVDGSGRSASAKRISDTASTPPLSASSQLSDEIENRFKLDSN